MAGPRHPIDHPSLSAGRGLGVSAAVLQRTLGPATDSGFQLFRNADDSITYTDPKGTAFKFVPVGNGTYNVPNDINAHLTRTVNASPQASISAGATYELVFHPSQITNVYVSDGANLKLTETRDVTGQNKITYTYGGGKLTSLTDTQGRVVSFGYSASPNPTQPTTIVDQSSNRTVTLAYAGPKGALSQVTAANGQNTTWAYNTSGKLSSITDGSGRRTDFTYGTGNKIATTVFGANNTAVSGTYTWAYPSTTTTTVTDPNNRAVTYTFNATSKQVTEVKDALNHKTASAWNPHGDLTSRTSAKNAVTGNATIYTVASSNFTYNLTKVTAPTGAGGAAGRASEATYPTTVVGNGATADYRPTSVKDQQNNVSNLTYNTWGQVATEARGVPAGGGTPAGGTWSYKYQGGSGATAATCGGKPGQICSYTDGKGNTTSFTYNAAGNLTTMTPPAPLGATSYTYDAAGRQITKLDGNGVTTYTCYDPDDRVFQVSTTSATCGTASGVRTTYDAAGNATGINNTTNSTVQTITFDAQNRPTNRSFTGAANASALASAATYDRASNVLTVTDGGTGAANTTTYTYDAANNVATLAEPGGSCPATPSYPNSTKCTGFSYDDNNQRTETRFANGTKSTVTYDSSDRWATLNVTTSGGGTLLGRTWTYTNATNADTGLVASQTDQAGNKFAYTYDSANRLTKAESKDNNGAGTTTWLATWTFDANGNRTQQIKNGATTNYGYNAADQLCWFGTGTSSTCTAPSGATTYTYDGNGNQTGIGYTPFNQQASTSGGSVTYSYGGTTNTQRLAANNVSYTPSIINGATTVHTCACGTQKIIRDPAGKPIAWQTGGQSYYFVTDRQDSVLLLTDSTQSRAAEYGYAPYGELYYTGYYKAGDNAYRYHGAFQDLGTTGLYKMGARYYNETTGRFTQPDPSGQEFNRYNFTNSDPVTYSDPSGLDFWDGLSTVLDGVSTVVGFASAIVPGGPGMALGAVATLAGVGADIAGGDYDQIVPDLLYGTASTIAAGAGAGSLGGALNWSEEATYVAGGVASAGLTGVQTCMDYC